MFATSSDSELPGRVVEELTACVKGAPKPSTSAEGDPPTYAIQFDVHVSEGGGVSSVKVTDSMLGGGGMEACLADVLRGAILPVRAQATQRAPQARGLMAAGPALAPAVAVLGPISWAPVVLTGLGIIVVVAVTIYVVTRDTTDEDREKERCKKVKQQCIAYCSDTTLPTPDFGWKFQKCKNDCLERHSCPRDS